MAHLKPQRFMSIRTDIVPHSFLGGGSFGATFKVEISSEVCALKQISIENYKNIYRQEEEPLTKILREIEVLKSLSESDPTLGHDNVTRYSSHWLEGPDKDNFEELNSPFVSSTVDHFNFLFVQMEYCNIGDLRRWMSLHKSKSDRPLATCQSVMTQVLAGLCFIHGHNIVHRDLSPANILLYSTNNENHLGVKIADFGLGRELREDATHVSTVELGARDYRSPEILRGDGKYDQKTDVFSAGIIFFELLLPVGTVNGLISLRAEVLDKLQRGEDAILDKLISGIEMIELCLAEKMTLSSQTKRFSSVDAYTRLIDHDFFRVELQQEEREKKILAYNVPTPTWKLFGREEELLQLHESFLTSGTIVIKGVLGIGKTELVKVFVYEKRKDAHCIWLFCQKNLRESMEKFAQTLESERTENFTENFFLAVNLVANRDSSIPIILVIDGASFHDFPTVQAILDRFHKDAGVSILITSRTEEIGTELTQEVDDIILKELDTTASHTWVQTALAPTIISSQEEEALVQKMTEIMHNHPALLHAFSGVVSERRDSPNPLGIHSSVQFLKTSLNELFLYSFLNELSLLQNWNEFVTSTLSKKCLSILQVLSTWYSELGSADSGTLEDVFKSFTEVGRPLFQEEGTFSSDLLTQALTHLCDAHLLEFTSLTAIVSNYEAISVVPVIKQLVLLQMENDDELGYDFLNDMLSIRNHPSITHCAAMQFSLQFGWDWALTAKTSWLLESPFQEATQTLMAVCNEVPLAKESDTFGGQDVHIILRTARRALQKQHGPTHNITHILRCHEIVWFLRKSKNNAPVGEIVILDLIKLKETLRVQKYERRQRRLSALLISEACPIAAQWILHFRDSSPVAKIHQWLINEISSRYVEREMYHILIAYLGISDPTRVPSTTTKKILAALGSALIKRTTSLELSDDRQLLPLMSIVQTFYDIIKELVGSQDKYDEEFDASRKLHETFRKIEILLSSNPVETRLAFSGLVDTFGAKELSWWSEAVFHVSDVGSAFLVKVLFNFISVNICMITEFFEVFKATRDRLSESTTSPDKKRRFAVVYFSTIETMRTELQRRPDSCYIVELQSSPCKLVQVLNLLHVMDLDSDKIAEKLQKERTKFPEKGSNDEIAIVDGKFEWISVSGKPLSDYGVMSLMTKKISSTLGPLCDEFIQQYCEDSDLFPLPYLWTPLLCLSSVPLTERREILIHNFSTWISSCSEEDLVKFTCSLCQYLENFLLANSALETAIQTVGYLFERRCSFGEFIQPIIHQLVPAIRLNSTSQGRKELVDFGEKLLSFRNSCQNVDSAIAEMCITILLLPSLCTSVFPDPPNDRCVALGLLKKWMNLNPKVKFESGSAIVTEEHYADFASRIITVFLKHGVGGIFTREMGEVILVLCLIEGGHDPWVILEKLLGHDSSDNRILNLYKRIKLWITRLNETSETRAEFAKCLKVVKGNTDENFLAEANSRHLNYLFGTEVEAESKNEDEDVIVI